MQLGVKKPALLAVGVLVLALAGVGCGDDDGGGSGGTGGAGTGGTGGAGTGGGGTGGSDVPTAAECEAAVETATMGMSEPACPGCLCEEESAREAVMACDATCWGLVSCSQAFNCTANMATLFTCLQTNCGDYTSAIGTATAARPALEGCVSECSPSSNMDAGDPDGGN